MEIQGKRVPFYPTEKIHSVGHSQPAKNDVPIIRAKVEDNLLNYQIIAIFGSSQQPPKVIYSNDQSAEFSLGILENWSRDPREHPAVFSRDRGVDRAYDEATPSQMTLLSLPARCPQADNSRSSGDKLGQRRGNLDVITVELLECVYPWSMSELRTSPRNPFTSTLLPFFSPFAHFTDI